jgi:DNA helicase HerA-like ATPase
MSGHQRLSPPSPPFRLPRDDEHTYIVGQNGTGKTQFAALLVSLMPLKSKPVLILDYKGDELLNSIERAREIGLNEVPSQPGLYIVHSHPRLKDETEEWLLRIWEHENVNLYIDEGYMAPDLGALEGIATQGRSKRIALTVLTQRPVWVNRFILSESKHVIAFHLNDERDEKTLQAVLPRGFFRWVPSEFTGSIGDDFRLPRYHSRWYNGADDSRYLMLPAPEADVILDRINKLLKPKRRWF